MITITTTPNSSLHSAFNPVIYKATTTRAVVGTTKVATSISSDGGKLRITSALHGLENGDCVELTTGWSGLNQTKSIITNVTANNFTLSEINYTGVASSRGQFIKNISKLRLKYSVTRTAGAIKIGSGVSNYQTGSEFTIDISAILQGEIDYTNGQYTPGADFDELATNGIVSPATTRASMGYYVTLTETYENGAGVLIEGNIATTSTAYAINNVLNNSESINTYLCSTINVGRWLTNLSNRYCIMNEGERIQLQALTSLPTVGVRITRTFTSGATAVENVTAVTVNNYRVTVNYSESYLFYPNNVYSVKLELISGITVISEPITIFKSFTKARTANMLKWRNLQGGVDRLYFPDSESSFTNEQFTYLSTEGYRITNKVIYNNQISMKAYFSNELLEWVKSLMFSKIVTYNNSRVAIKDRNITANTREFVETSITILTNSIFLN